MRSIFRSRRSNRADVERRLSRDPLPLRGHSSVRRERSHTTSFFSRSPCIILAPTKRCGCCAAAVNFRRGQSWWRICAVDGSQRSALTLLTTFFFREPMTRNDARVSAARAFSFAELENLAKAAGWRGYSHRALSFCPTGDLAGASVVQPIRKMRIISNVADLSVHLRGQTASSRAGPDNGRASCRACFTDSACAEHAGKEAKWR